MEHELGSTVFSYKGPISPEFTRTLLNSLENRLENEPISIRFKRNVFTVATEALQNIEKYALVTDAAELQPSVLITNSENAYIFTFSNAITRASYPEFRRKLDFIRVASISELRDEYLRQLFDETQPESTSAGLGLLAIAIRANKLLEYTFKELDENNMRVSLTITTER